MWGMMDLPRRIQLICNNLSRFWHRFSRPCIIAAGIVLLAGAFAAPQSADAYQLPATHPRIFFTSTSIATIAERCKPGGTHRPYYDELKEYADYAVNNNKKQGADLPNISLTYKIHKYWNDTNYNGGGFQEDAYWTFVRDAIIGPAWPGDGGGAEHAMAADWIWEKLTASDLAEIKTNYGPARTSFADGATWRGGTSFWVCTSMFRGMLLAGSSVDTGSYDNEYQGICAYIEDVYTKALDLAGGPGWNGGVYATQNVDERVWTLEAFTSATGLNGWGMAQKYGSEYSAWIYYSTPPHRGTLEENQDYNIPIFGDSWKNLAIMATRMRDPWSQRHTNRSWNNMLGRSAGHYKNASVWSLVLFYDPTLSEADPVSMPHAVRLGAGGMDHVYMMSDMGDNNATWASFEAGKSFYGHQHKDAGSFTIHRKGDLIIDSGYYGQYRSVKGGWHAKHYYQRSTAHNCMAIYDPGENFYWGASGVSSGTVSNDGGQPMPSSGPSYNKVLTDPVYHPGDMLSFETNSEYTYSQADLYGAYDYEAFAASRNAPSNPTKIDSYTREFVYLRPNYFVVYDRVVSTNPNFTKVWNMHVTADPEIFGAGGVQRAGDSEAGIWDYADASLAKATDGNDSYDNGSVFLKTLLPKDRVMRKIGGRNRSDTGYAYWIGGFDGQGRYDPTQGANYYWGDWTAGNEYNESFLTSRATPGWGRIEVEASTPQTDDLFLNVLYPVDNTTQNIPETNLIETSQMVGAEIVNDRVILFSRAELAGLDSVTYTLAGHDTSALHMICNLKKNETYRVYRSGATIYIRKDGMPDPGAGIDELITPAPTSSNAGIIAFYDDGTAIGPPPSEIQISGVIAYASGVGTYAVTITWTTDLPSDSQVEYGSTASYTGSAYDPAHVTNHSITIFPTHDATYHYRVTSTAPPAIDGVSSDFSFHFDVESPEKVIDLQQSSAKR